MTAPPHLSLAGQPVSRRRLRRLSREFAAVGIRVPPARLAQIAAGQPADAATHIRHEQVQAKRIRAKRHCVHSAIVVGATVLALITVVCLGLGFFLMAGHISPF